MQIVETLAHIIDGIAVVVLIAGFILSILAGWRDARAAGLPLLGTLTGDVLRGFRIALGRWLLVALEILIVSDILHSIAHRTLEEVTFLAGIVVIRTVLAYFLDQEVARMERRQAENAKTADV